MPKISIVCFRELDGNVSAARSLRFHIHHAAFPLFFREAVDKQNGLAEFHFLGQRKDSSVRADVARHRHVAKRSIFGSASVHSYWNR